MTSLAWREAEFLLYQTEDGRSRVEVRFDGDTAWLSLGQRAELFQRDKGYRVKSHRATAPRSPARPSVRGSRIRRTGPRGARR